MYDMTTLYSTQKPEKHYKFKVPVYCRKASWVTAQLLCGSAFTADIYCSPKVFLVLAATWKWNWKKGPTLGFPYKVGFK